MDERLLTKAAFRRFVAHVSLRAGRWLAHRGVPESEREDVLQAALLRMHQERERFDPALGRWESWAYAFVGRVIQNYRTGTRNRTKVVNVAVEDELPDIVSDAASPEEETAAAMMQALLKKCMAQLDKDSQAIIYAYAEGIQMQDIAASFGLSRSAAYDRVKTARERLQAALNREQERKRALGVMVLPLTIDQLLAADTRTAHFSPEAMRRLWKTLDRVMAADVAAGKLRDDGTEVPRYMGSPNVTAPRTGLGARILRILGPKAVSAFTHLGTAAAGGAVVYLLMRNTPTPPDTTAARARRRQAWLHMTSLPAILPRARQRRRLRVSPGSRGARPARTARAARTARRRAERRRGPEPERCGSQQPRRRASALRSRKHSVPDPRLRERDQGVPRTRKDVSTWPI